MIKRKLMASLVSGAIAFAAGAAQAQISDGVIKIGVVNDMSGLYADLTGQGAKGRWSATAVDAERSYEIRRRIGPASIVSSRVNA